MWNRKSCNKNIMLPNSIKEITTRSRSVWKVTKANIPVPVRVAFRAYLAVLKRPWLFPIFVLAVPVAYVSRIRKNLRRRPAGSGYGLIRPEVPDIGWNTIAYRRMYGGRGRMGTRDRGISGGWGCKVERGKLKEIYLERERKEEERSARDHPRACSGTCSVFPPFALFNRISPVRSAAVIYVGRWITMNGNVY